MSIFCYILSQFLGQKSLAILIIYAVAEMETGRVAGRVEILRPAGQAG